MSIITKITENNGQKKISIPKDIAKKLNLTKGSYLSWEIDENGIKIKKVC